MKKRGVGFSSSFQGVNYHFGHPDISAVELCVTAENTLLVRTAASDLGQGLEAMLISVASTAFGGFPAEKIRWEGSNTTAPEAGGTGASRQSTLTGNALFQACRQLQDQLRAVAAEHLDVPPDTVVFAGEAVQSRERSAPLDEIFAAARQMGAALQVTGRFQAPLTSAVDAGGKGKPVNQFGYATHAAEVEVDTVTGEVSVLRVMAFHDAGTVLNETGASGQVEGAVVMGMGFALTEEYLLERGKPVNLGFTNYILPSIADAPEIEVHFCAQPSPIGELGVKGLAEIPTATIAPAIANAIYNATGARVRRIPATPERVLEALAALEDAEGEGS